MIDTFLILAGGLCVILGIIGCVLPVLPGPLLAYAGMLLFELSSAHPFSINTMIIFGVITIGVSVIDYIVPVYGAKVLKGSRYGIWGSAAGLIIGTLIFFPAGILIGPVLGAFIGEIISRKRLKDAFLPAIGAFIGFMTGTILKLSLTIVIGYFYTKEAYFYLL
jgi:hypothetical protein